MTQEKAQPTQTNPATNLRNRLVGSIILVAAAVIIIPSVLDGQKNSHKDDFKNIPERGDYEKVQQDKPFPKNEFEQHLPAESMETTDEQPVDADELVDLTLNQPAEQSKEVLSNDTITVNTLARPVDFDNPQPPVTTASEQAQPKATASGSVEKSSPFSSNAWVIQLGVFGKKANVAALEKRLNDAGFATFNRDVRFNNGRVLTKVYVGPELDKAVLEKAMDEVNKIAGVKGKIASYKVKS